MLIHNLSKKGIKAPNPLVGSPWLKSGFMSQAYYVLEGKSRSRRAFKQICVNSVLKSYWVLTSLTFHKIVRIFSVKLSHFWPITFSFPLNWWKLIALKRVVSQIVELKDLVPPHFEREKVWSNFHRVFRFCNNTIDGENERDFYDNNGKSRRTHKWMNHMFSQS